MDGWVGGWVDGWMDKWMNGKIIQLCFNVMANFRSTQLPKFQSFVARPMKIHVFQIMMTSRYFDQCRGLTSWLFACSGIKTNLVAAGSFKTSLTLSIYIAAGPGIFYSSDLDAKIGNSFPSPQARSHPQRENLVMFSYGPD